MAKNELHIKKNFYLLGLAEHEIKKSLNKFDPWMSMVRLSRCLCQGNVFVLIFDLVQHVAPLFCSGHWHNYFLQLGHAVWASVQSIFLRCLWLYLPIFLQRPLTALKFTTRQAERGTNLFYEMSMNWSHFALLVESHLNVQQTSVNVTKII